MPNTSNSKNKNTVVWTLLQVIAVPALVIATTAYQSGNNELAIGGFIVAIVALVLFALSIQFEFAWESDLQDVLQTVNESQVKSASEAVGDTATDVVDKIEDEDMGS